MLSNITISQSRYLNASTSERYFQHCHAFELSPATLKVPTKEGDISAHWLGPTNAVTIVLYCHGGGYTQSANHGNFRYMTRLVNDTNSNKACKSVSVLVLAYTLAPEAIYPTQLREAAAVLSYVTNDLGRSPSDIIISGDSAGGNLAISLLSHLQHPHPDVVPVTLRQPLGGAMLYSPWTGFSTTYPSFENEKLDMLSPLALRKWSAMFMGKANPIDPERDPGPVTGDDWTEPCRNSSSWWSGLHSVVSDIFVHYGSHEVLADPIKELEVSLKAGWADGGADLDRIIFFEAPGEAHIAPIVDIMSPGNNVKSTAQVAIEEWFQARLRA